MTKCPAIPTEKEEAEINKEIDGKLKEAKSAKDEQKKLMEQELELSRKQRVARVSGRVTQESKKIDEIADALSANGIDTCFTNLESLMGHDAFLVDYDHFNPEVISYFNQVWEQDELG